MEASKIQDLRNDGGGQCLYLLHKETVNLGEIGRTKKTDVWELQLVRNSKQNLGRGSKLGEVTRFVYMGFSGPEFPVPDVKDVCLPPGASSAPPPPAGRVLFTGEMYSLLSGDKGGSECCSYTRCFFINLNSK